MPVGDKKMEHRMQWVFCTVHECVIDVKNCRCKCESEMRQAIVCARYVLFILLFTAKLIFCLPKCHSPTWAWSTVELLTVCWGDKHNENRLK
jgi:hypothetical protein